LRLWLKAFLKQKVISLTQALLELMAELIFWQQKVTWVLKIPKYAFK
jgi:hypothetical protein